MNFLKNSIFSRRSGEEVQEQMPENENQMLAVWGSPGSGKTTVAVKLAARLAMQKRDVALLLCDMNTPMLPCICPPGELEEEHSLGSILAATHVSESLVRHNCITHKRFRHLTLLGMRKGENEYTYPPYERTQAEELLQCLRGIAPYIIIDWGSYIANDKQERKAAKSLETHLMTAAVRLSKWIHMDEYKRGRMNNILKASGLNLSPEVYQAYAIVKSGAVLSAVIPCLFLLPLLSPVVVILAVLLYSITFPIYLAYTE